MKVWEIKDQFGLDNLSLSERPDPAPGPGEVLVRMRAASLNYRDLVTVSGGYGKAVRAPLVPCSDGAGEVMALGPGVTGWTLGERVMPIFFQAWQDGGPTGERFASSLGGHLDGTLAEYRVLRADGIVATPPHLTDEEAACLPCAALTAWSALIEQGSLRPGETVLIQGTGGVSLFALQFAKMVGATVILTSSSDDKLARGREMGADHLINYRAVERWAGMVKELTGGEGCDHVVEVGGAGTLNQSVRAVRAGGTVSLIGVLSGAAGQLDLPLVLMRNVRIQGVTVGSRAMMERMGRAIAAAGLRPVVDRVFPFHEAPDAFRHLQAGGHFGKIAVQVG